MIDEFKENAKGENYQRSLTDAKRHKGRLIVQEMTELLVLDLVRKRVVTKKMELNISYDRESLTVLSPGKTKEDTVYAVAKTGKEYTDVVTPDMYGSDIATIPPTIFRWFFQAPR